MSKKDMHELLVARIKSQNQETQQYASDIFNIEFGAIGDYFSKKLERIAIEHITPNPRNARIEFKQETLDTLAKSIESEGLLNPITVRQMGLNKYQIVAGERRYRACKQLGFEKIECIVVALSDEQTDFLMLTENLVREDVSTYEIAKGVIEFENNYPTKKEFAKLLGISRQKLYKLLSYKRLPNSVLEVLGRNPSLLPDYAAEQIATLENKGHEMTVMEPIILQALDLVKEGKMESSRVGEFVKDNLKNEGLEKKPVLKTVKHDLSNKNGDKLGSFKKTAKGITISLDAGYLNDDLEQKIMAYLQETLSGGVSQNQTQQSP